MFKKYFIILILIVSSISLYAKGNKSNTSIKFNILDAKIFTDKAFEQLTQVKLIKKNKNKMVLQFDKIENRTSVHINTSIIKLSLKRKILNSKIFIIKSDNKMTRLIQKEKEKQKFNSDSKTIKRQGYELKADLVFSGYISSIKKKINKKQKTIFIFKYKLIDKNNKAVYENKISIKK